MKIPMAYRPIKVHTPVSCGAGGRQHALCDGRYGRGHAEWLRSERRSGQPGAGTKLPSRPINLCRDRWVIGTTDHGDDDREWATICRLLLCCGSVAASELHSIHRAAGGRLRHQKQRGHLYLRSPRCLAQFILDTKQHGNGCKSSGGYSAGAASAATIV